MQFASWWTTTNRSPHHRLTSVNDDSRNMSGSWPTGGEQWPEPWLSLNPLFAGGGSISELVTEGLLHSECERIFARSPR